MIRKRANGSGVGSTGSDNEHSLISAVESSEQRRSLVIELLACSTFPINNLGRHLASKSARYLAMMMNFLTG